MSIPRELRDLILAYIIQSPISEAPEIVQSFSDLTSSRKILAAPKLRSRNNTVLYPSSDPCPNTTSLLLTNHQLRSETLEQINRPGANECDLDIIILDEILPLPTWTRIPSLSKSFEKVNVTYRISGAYDVANESRLVNDVEGPYEKYGQHKGFKWGGGTGIAIRWQIYSILERFVRVGPRGETNDEHAHHHITVKTININVETPAGVDLALFDLPMKFPFSTQRNPETVLSPVYLARFVAWNIEEVLQTTGYPEGLLPAGHHEWFRYGAVFFEHVDCVVVRLDGKVLMERDVAECLKNAGGFKEKHLSKQDLAEYKRETWKVRRERGLRVL
ncbi:hypothetical protein FB567DRAFT_595504 [Paraphoma chrysanthemicola]|uniref:Uncharacterized protein n=1 Tax=Paraphoma chrysanthemicola TaxID=798071 RepID=A0A8K0QY41_9PLEO|nr:hypothetical protein FB567DRAFT_595504 [Paraphoma chrysanthemicola]